MYTKRVNQGPRYVGVFFGAYLAIFSSLFFSSFFGDTTGIPPPNIGVYAMLVGGLHFLPMFIALKGGIRVNPYVSAAEWFFTGKIQFYQFILEALAQAAGAALATLSVWAILQSVPLYVAGLGGSVTNTTAGWAFFLEAIAVMFLSWTHFAYRDPVSLAAAVAATCAIVLPFIGATTHNPYRWLGACIVEGTCGASGSWIYATAPLVGVIVGYYVALVNK